MQIQAIAAVASPVDDRGAQRVDVEFCRLFWILGLQMYVVEFQRHETPPRVVGENHRSPTPAARLSGGYLGKARSVMTKAWATSSTHPPRPIISRRIGQDAADVKRCFW